jgi:hypothetical protein
MSQVCADCGERGHPRRPEADEWTGPENETRGLGVILCGICSLPLADHAEFHIVPWIDSSPVLRSGRRVRDPDLVRRRSLTRTAPRQPTGVKRRASSGARPGFLGEAT